MTTTNLNLSTALRNSQNFLHSVLSRPLYTSSSNIATPPARPSLFALPQQQPPPPPLSPSPPAPPSGTSHLLVQMHGIPEPRATLLSKTVPVAVATPAQGAMPRHTSGNQPLKPTVKLLATGSTDPLRVSLSALPGFTLLASAGAGMDSPVDSPQLRPRSSSVVRAPLTGGSHRLLAACTHSRERRQRLTYHAPPSLRPMLLAPLPPPQRRVRQAAGRFNSPQSESRSLIPFFCSPRSAHSPRSPRSFDTAMPRPSTVAGLRLEGLISLRSACPTHLPRALPCPLRACPFTRCRACSRHVGRRANRAFTERGDAFTGGSRGAE